MSRIPLNVDTYEANEIPGAEIARFVVLYGKASTRKHKIWEGDGVLVCYSDAAVLKSEDEKDTICRSSALKSLEMLENGRIINIGSWSVEIQERVAQKGAIPQLKTYQSPLSLPLSLDSAKKPAKRSSSGFSALLASQSTPKRPAFKSPLITDNGPLSEVKAVPPMVLNEQEVIRREAPPILVDPRFARALRDHQKEGVRFIFEKLKGQEGGAILADEMGLGKSIQTMAATWALLRGSKSAQNLAKTCLIIVPSSLVNNWKAEFDKWWRQMRFPAVIALSPTDITAYQGTMKTMPYLVISYDMALRHVEKLRSVRFDVMVCDEAHKMKNVDSKLRKALFSLSVPRRLLLSGTPFQNDLSEFHSLLDFARPDVFGTPSEFEKNCHQNPEVVNPLVDETLLRRMAKDVNTSHLPKKHEYILFCAASGIQKSIHSEITDYMTGDPLSLIFFARQLANHPKLLYDNLREKHDKANQKHSALLLAFDGPLMPRGGVKESGKLMVLVDMLKCFRERNERTVVVSNFLETLDMVQQLCEYLEFQIYRLDGKTQVPDRQRIVRNFNETSALASVFLLSTKAGGAGLNLTGASRLVLFDSDWNPANDQQAMARIWRDGQVRECHIYRLVTTGTIEEKMLQRQIKKTGLGCVIDAIEVGDTVSTFTDEELKDIFTYISDTECNTHDLCECPCDGQGVLATELDSDEEEEDSDNDKEGDKKEEDIEDSDDDGEVDDEELEESPEEEKENDKSDKKEEEDDDEVVEDSQEDREKEKLKKKIEKKKRNERKLTPGAASLAELSLWRHFSPRHPATWRYFMNEAGLSQDDNDVELTFAFYQQSQY